VRPSFVALLTALLGLAVVPYPAAPATASCAAPWLSFDGDFPGRGRVEVVRGEELTVQGRGFVEGCDDTGGGSAFGCSGEDVRELEKPLQDVELVVLQGQPTMEQTPLAVADAEGAVDDHLGWITWTFIVPASLDPGPAIIKTEGSEPLRVRVVG
jgi:hypothetical protein